LIVHSAYYTKGVLDHLVGKFFYRKNFFSTIRLNMSKRYSGKSFKDSSVSKKPKLSLKEKRKFKKEKAKKS